MIAVLRNAGGMAVTVLSMTQLAGLGLPAVLTLAGLTAFLAVAALAWASWILNDADRAQRMTRLLTAIRVTGRRRPP